ncbi:HD domain-containing protein [Candidatus Woesearchaeota archaeon]|nr:HD domain-containing protein [Candidatus Woesearchaeota archaeon]
MEDLLKFRVLNKLKSVYRMNSVDNRKESSAEHTYSCLLLADYFFDKIEQRLDKQKVYELLLYHDIVEIETGDSPITPDKDHQKARQNKKQNELVAAKELKGKLPKSMQKKFFNLFLEFENEKTVESRFAKAIDTLDAFIHEIDRKEDWKGWSKKFLVDKKEKYFEEFPLMLELFHKLLNYVEKQGYFNQ